MSFFKSKERPVYFITKNFSKKLSKKSILVLSPEFYWTKKANLNIKYTFEASKMAQSIFDGVLPPGNYKYKVFKIEQNEFIFIAYDIEHILNDLRHIGIDMQMIDKIYTIQSELLDKDISLKIDDEHAIVSNEGVIAYIPLKLLNTKTLTTINDILKEKKLSSNYIYSNSSKRLQKNYKETNLVLLFLVILAVVLLLNVLKIQKERSFLAKQRNNLIQQYNLPKTSFQIKNIQKEFSRIDLKQSSLKKAIDYLGKFKLFKGEYFELLSYKNSKMIFAVKLLNKNREKEFEKYIKRKFKIIREKSLKTTYIAEVSL